MDSVLIVALLVSLPALLVTAMVSAARTDQRLWRAIGRSKDATIVLILITGGIGGLYYWLRIQPALRRQARVKGSRPLDRGSDDPGPSTERA